MILNKTIYFSEFVDFLPKDIALISRDVPKNKISEKKLVGTNYINRKFWNRRIRGTAIPEADFQKSRPRTI